MTIVLFLLSAFSLQLIDNYVGGRGTITENVSNGNSRSNIYVPKATVMDSGNYTCISPGLKTNSTVKVHVLVDGELARKSILSKIYYHYTIYQLYNVNTYISNFGSLIQCVITNKTYIIYISVCLTVC